MIPKPKPQSTKIWERIEEAEAFIAAEDGISAAIVLDPSKGPSAIGGGSPVINSYTKGVKNDIRYYDVEYSSPPNPKLETTIYGDPLPFRVYPPDVHEEMTKLDTNMEEFVEAQSNLEISPPSEPEFVEGATHYIFLPPEDNIFAILRAGFISSKQEQFRNNSENSTIDVFKNKKYSIDQKYFTNVTFENKNNPAGYPLEHLERNSVIQVLREGYGIGGRFFRVATYDEESKKWNYKEKDNPAFIDSHTLKKFEQIQLNLEAADAELKTKIIEQKNIEKPDDAAPPNTTVVVTGEDDESSELVYQQGESSEGTLPEYAGILWDKFLSFVETDDPDPNFVEPDWTVSEIYDLFLNKKTREYNIPVEVDIGETLEEAKRKGIQFLLEYYDKISHSSLIDRLMYAGGPNYSNIETEEPSEGLFATVKEEHSSNRDDGLKKYLVTIPETYLNHPSLDPNMSDILTRQEYLDAGLVSYSYYIKNRDLKSKIETLIQNLSQFKSRINSYSGTLTISAEDVDRKIERLKLFQSAIREFLELNDESLDDDAIIDIALDELFKVTYIVYNKQEDLVDATTQEEEKQNSKKEVGRFLRKGLNCINLKNKVFEDRMTSAYLFYADQIKDAIKNNQYPGIELVQKFTVPIPEAFPSKKSESTKDRVEDIKQEEESLTSKDTKTNDEIKRQNELLGNPESREEKAALAAIETFIAGDEIFENFDNLLESVGTITELFDSVLDKVPLFNLIAKAALCLINKLGIDDVVDAISNAFLSMIKALEMILILTNRLLIDLIEQACPGSTLKIETIINNAFDTALQQAEEIMTVDEREIFNDILDEIINARFEKRDVDLDNIEIDLDSSGLMQALGIVLQQIILDVKKENLLSCIMSSTCEAKKKTEGIEMPPGEVQSMYSSYGEDADSLEAETAGTELGGIDTQAVDEGANSNVPEEYAAYDASIADPNTKGFVGLLNKVSILKTIDCEILTAISQFKNFGKQQGEKVIKKKMEQIGVRMPMIDYSDDPLYALSKAIPIAINKILNEVITPIVKTILQELARLCQGLGPDAPLENKAAHPKNYNDLSADDLEDLNNFFDSKKPNLNLPGDTNILDGMNDAAHANLGNIINDVMSGAAGIPLTPGTIAEAKALIDVMSNILRPTEICTLLSGTATATTLRIILKIVQARPEFSLISDHLETTDDIAKLFSLLGRFVNNNYCSTATEDIALITILCEKQLNEDLYWDALKKKGFTDEQIEDIINNNTEREKAKLATLEEMLSAESLSDYFQDKLPIIHCTPDKPGALPVNDNFMNDIIDLMLESVLSVVRNHFEQETLGIKSVLIDEQITPYGGNFPRPPELGRDYMNDEIPTGSINTPMEGKLFTKTAYLAGPDGDGTGAPHSYGLDELNSMCPTGKDFGEYGVGEQIIANWPMIDKIDRLVAPSFIEESKQIRTYGSIGYKKSDSIAFDATIASKKFYVSVNQINDKNEKILLEQKRRINELAGNDEFLESTKGLLDSLIERKNLVEYRLPSYAYIQSEEFAQRELPYDYCSFKTSKIPINKKGKNIRTTNFELLHNSQDPETLKEIEKFINMFVPGSLDIKKDQGRTLHELIFAKLLGESLKYFSPLEKKDFEIEAANLFPFLLSTKQDEIIKECLKSRFFSAFNLDKLIASPLSEDAINALKCSDYPNINLDNLRKGLLDFDDIKKDVKDFYNDIACETHTRKADEADPLDDAIRYAMIVIMIKLIVAEIIFRSLFFFSRFGAEATMVNSDLFITLTITKLKEHAKNSESNPHFYKEIKDIARKRLISLVEGNGGRAEVLSNVIVVDTNSDPDIRQFTNFSNGIFNLADLTALEKSLKTKKTTAVSDEILNKYAIYLDEAERDIYTSALEDLDLNNVAAAQIIYGPAISKLKSKFDNLALKNMINNIVKTMVPKVDSLLLDRDRVGVDTTKLLLSSNTIFDVQSDMLTVDEAITRQNGYLDEDDLRASLADLSSQFEEEHSLNPLDHYYNIIDESNYPDPQYMEKAMSILTEYTDAYTNLSFSSKEGFTNPAQLPENINIPDIRGINIINYRAEKEDADAGLSTNIKNICLDATDTDDKLFAYSTKSTFYDRYGRLTELGESTKNGGFIVQKFVDVEMRDVYSFEEDDEETNAEGNQIVLNQPKVLFWTYFRSAVTGLTKEQVEDEDWSENKNKHSLSYKQFDFAIVQAYRSLVDSGYMKDPDYINLSLDSIFKSIKQTFRLVYVLPHDMPSKSVDAVKKMLIAVKKILINKINEETDDSDDLAEMMANQKIYEIKEPVADASKWQHHWNGVHVATTNNIVNSFEDFNISGELYSERKLQEIAYIISDSDIKSFYLLPIPGATASKKLTNIEELTIKEVGQIYDIWNKSLSSDIASNSKIGLITPIVENLGQNQEEMLADLFDTQSAKILNNYVLSSTNLLNFAVLQQVYFPYSQSFDLDDLFAMSKKAAGDIFVNSEEPRNNWSSDIDLGGWAKSIGDTMSAIVPDGAFFQWLIEVVPKFILRFIIAATDPCMKEAFKQQDENEWDDSKLPEIVFGSLFTNPGNCSKEFKEIVESVPGLELALSLIGISAPGDKTEEEKCLLGIRPTPIFPPYLPFFGDSSKPISTMGLIYTMMQFLIGRKEEFSLEEIPDVGLQIGSDGDCAPSSDDKGSTQTQSFAASAAMNAIVDAAGQPALLDLINNLDEEE